MTPPLSRRHSPRRRSQGARLALGAALAFSLMAAVSTATVAAAADEFIVVQSTTSTQNSGLFDELLPKFTEATGIEVRVVAVGTGQAIENASNGDGDVLFVHAKDAEEAFVADGGGVERFDVMYNDFVIVGPEADPADIGEASDAPDALRRIASAGADGETTFDSRGDDSGTHKAELKLWGETDVDPAKASGGWYRETGSGMGATLNIASGTDAYAMTDRATWISFGNKGDLEILYEGDAQLFNQYGVILVNPEKHPNVKAEAGQQFVDWVTSEAGQEAIAAFEVDGQQLFFPNAKASN